MNFRQVRKKIKTVSNVKQITKAMQMVASVKMRKSQDVALEGKPYREVLDRVVKRLLAKADQKDLSFLRETAAAEKSLYIIISSNKGLCGGFNFNLFKLVFSQIDLDKSSFITVGKKGAEFVARIGADVVADFSASVPFVDQVPAISAMIQEAFLTRRFGSVHILHNAFISTMLQEPHLVKILPVGKISDVDFIPDDNTAKEKNSTIYEIEPSPMEVLKSVMQDYITDRIRGAILESDAAEHSARMIAMKNATDNANELIINLTLLRNKLRQASITNELLEITTASETTRHE